MLQLNALSHWRHLYGFSPVWILLCLVRSLACVNRFRQTEHSNAFSPEWVRLCPVNECLLWHLFPHSLHLCLSLWIFIWRVKCVLFEKHFWHSVHEYTLSPARLSLPSLKRHWFANWLLPTTRSGDIGFLFCRCLLISTSDHIVLQLSPTHYSAQYTGFFINVSLLFLIICIKWVCLLQLAMSIIANKANL